MQFVVHLDDPTVAALVDAGAADAAVASAFAAWGRGQASTSQRVRAGVDGVGMASAMAAVVPPYCGGKVYATHRGRFTFVNVLFGADGALLATLDGDVITRLRTPAASALAIDHLAPDHAAVAAVIGTGRLAAAHLDMLRRTLPGLREVRVCGRRRSVAADIAAGIATDELTAIGTDDPVAAVEGANVIVTITSARDPLFPSSAVGDDALICAVGATKHDRAEIDPALVARCATVVCDDVAGSRVECGDLIRAASAGFFDWARAVELHDVAAGSANIAWAGDAPVLFETQGVAIQDVAVSAVAFERFVGCSSQPVPVIDAEHYTHDQPIIEDQEVTR
jgi:ornithine cyclodeaminase/alanine dehydrogenase-like protein (mu-crystallin family)